MNCTTAQRLMHLAASGELPAADAVRLAEHETTCAACRTGHEDMLRVLAALPACTRSGEPNPSVLAAIGGEIRRRAGERPAMVWMLPPVRWIACAACLLILAAAGYWRVAADGGLRLQLHRAERVSAIVTIVSGETAGFAPAATAKGEDHLRALALQILRMEGLHVEVEEPVDEDITSDLEPMPRNPQSHNTDASRPEECV